METASHQTFEKTDFTKETLGQEYESCVFSQCNFVSVNLSNIKFSECEFVNCNMSNVVVGFCSLGISHHEALHLSQRHCSYCNSQIHTLRILY